MMHAILHGIQRLDFEPEPGQRVVGTKLHITHPARGVEGQKAGSVFLHKDIPLPDGLKPGIVIDLSVVIGGGVEAVSIVQSK
jgi:hypothetical protein